MTRRVLVTGSRLWSDRQLISDVLSTLLRELYPAGRPEASGQPTLVHGNARGADRIARDIWTGWGLPHDPFTVSDAQWRACGPECPPDRSCRRRRKGSADTYCSEAGHRRNWRMVESGPVVCLAFHLGDSPGTARCIEYAESEGIPVRRWTA